MNSDLEAKKFTHTDIKEWEAALGEGKAEWQNRSNNISAMVVREQIR